jgi:hypothetical protein
MGKSRGKKGRGTGWNNKKKKDSWKEKFYWGYREGEGWGIRMKRLFLEIFEGVILCLVMCISIVIRNPKIKHSLLLIYLGPVV